VHTSAFDGYSYPRPVHQRTIVYLLSLPSAQHDDVNRLLKRAALLHTDITVLLPSPPPTFFDLPSPFSGRVTFLAKDGQRAATARSGFHIEFVSWLFDGVKPDPGADVVVGQWYKATAAWLQAQHRVGDAEWLLARASGVVLSDPVLHFYGGAVAETIAAPRIRHAMPAIGAQTRYAERHLLERAATSHRRAVVLSPDFAEARLHLGRVMGQLGRREDARRELERAASGLTDRVLQYYAALFLGQEQVLAGDHDAAQLSFARAQELFPSAQSPLLARADLSQRVGDSPGALAALRQLLALPAVESERFDPWWLYQDSHVRDASARMESWRTVAVGETRR
jgi:hypothetical protein